MHSKQTQIIYVHTMRLSRRKIKSFLKYKQPFEMDISLDGGMRPYLGHPLKWYHFHHRVFSRPISLRKAVALVASQDDVPIILDIKDRRAIRAVEDIIKKLGGQRCIVHAFASELVFDKHETYAEPHRKLENIPVKDLKYLKDTYGCTLMFSARGYATASKSDILQAFESIKSIMDVFTPNEPGLQVQMPIASWLHAHDKKILLDFNNPKVKPAGDFIATVNERIYNKRLKKIKRTHHR